MAIIISYPNATDVTLSDKLLGTQIDGDSNTGTTKNFSVSDIIAIIPPGATGATGATGPIGATGSPGAAGPVGPTGLPGTVGAQGQQGDPGPIGPAGLNWQGAWVNGNTYGEDDAVGYGGASWFCILPTSGTTNPSIDTTHWALLASQGAPGVQGPAGANGSAGATGAQGTTGNTGATGPQGSNGVNGLNGATGPQGPQGLAGVDGAAGATGATGADGNQGPAGPIGPAGLNWQGVWVEGSSYIEDDVVSFGGASWFCILPTSGPASPNNDTLHWALLASQGAQGPEGPAGQVGPTGPTGSAGVDGAQGPIGPVGLTGATGPAGAPGGINTLNGLTADIQIFQVGTAGTDFNITSSIATHTFNLPDASISNRGVITIGAQSFAGDKTFTGIPYGPTAALGTSTTQLATTEFVLLNSGGGSSTSMGPLNGTASVEGATIISNVLRLSPASSSFGGIVNTGTQTFAGEKTFNTDVIYKGYSHFYTGASYAGFMSANTSFWQFNTASPYGFIFTGSLGNLLELDNSNGDGLFLGNVKATGFKIPGGTSAQYLLADGTTTTIAAGIAWLESNATDLTVWNNGKGNVATNSSFGDGALMSNITGNNNTAIGYRALKNNDIYGGTISNNTAVGCQSLFWNTTGIDNTSVGALALIQNTFGSNGVAMGRNALTANTEGDDNVALGSSALSQITTGDNNIGLGRSAGANANTSSFDNIYIGKSGPTTTTIESNKLYINNSFGVPLIGGDFTSRVVTIDNILKLTPTTAALPVIADPGSIIVQGVGASQHIYCWLNGAWKQLDN